MGVQDHKIAATSAGHEGHGVYHCHRCGWPFPKPHPSSKHRRAHKRLCGTIEGYKVIHSDHLAVSDDDGASDDDELHTPSPNIVKKLAESSGKVGGKSTKSEDDVYSDAVTDFSDSGISPQSQERFESVSELGKSLEQKSVEGDLYGSGVLEVEEAAVNADKPEQYNDARSEELSKPGYMANGNNQTDNVISINTAAEKVSVGLINDSQPEHGLGGSDQGEMIPGHDADIQVQERGLASLPLDSREGKVSDQTVAAGESQDELCDKFVSEAAGKDDSPPPSESLQTNASEGVDGVVHSADVSTSIKTVEDALVDETVGNIGSTASVGENTLLEGSLLSTSLVKPNETTETLDVTEHSIDKKERPKTSLNSVDASEGEKSDMTGDSKNESLEFKNLGSVVANSALGSTNNAFPCEDNNTLMVKKDVDHCGEHTNSTTLETENEKVKEASAEPEAISDSPIPSEKRTDSSSSRAADSDAKSLQELSENNSSSLEFKDDDFEKSIQGDGADKVTEVKQSVGSAGAGSEANEIDDALDKSSFPMSSLERTVSPVTSELQNNIQVATIAETVSKLEDDDGADKVTEVKQSVGSAGAGSEANEIDDALDKSSSPTSSLECTMSPVTSELQNNIQVATIAETVSKLEDDDGVVVSTQPLSDSVLLSESAANDGSGVGEDYKASESITTVEVAAEDHESNVVSREISETFTPSVQEVFPPDLKQTHSSDDLSTSKSVDLISSEHTFDGKVSKPDECSESSDTTSLKQPVPSPSDVEDFRGTSDTVNDKTVIDVEDVTGVDAKSVKTEADYKPAKPTDDASAVEMSSCLISRSDSLEANCGSVVSDTLETNSQKHKSPSEEAHPDKSDAYEPPSFMTLVQSASEGDHKVTAATEIETVQNNQQPKSDALQAGWFPSLTNVVNESEGRKKNEEIIAKVTNWTPVKQQHGPLKSLLNEVKSPNTKQVPAANQKVEAEAKHDNMGSVVASETHTAKDQGTNKHVEEWNSPARYPIEIKKEKKKGRPFWVPFVCCSSAHRDL